MAKTKVYFWLKIDKKFFENIFIKRLKTVPGGYTMIVIYIRLMLESLDSDCVLYYEGYFETLKEELALKLDVSEDDIDMTMAYFIKCGLIQIDEDKNAEMPQAKAIVMSETNWAGYKRNQRGKEKLDNVQSNLTNSNSCPTEIELEKELDIEKEQQLEQKEKNAAGVGKNPIFEKLKEAFGEMAISGTIVREVEDLLESHGKVLVMHALDETILNNGRSIRYTRSILERWKGQGLNTVEQVKQSRATHDAKKQQTNQPEPTSYEDWIPTQENPF